jgi:hypothetical protein
MPDEVSKPSERPPFDFQLTGPIYDPRDWYWHAEDGRIYSSARQVVITDSDPTYAEWIRIGYVSTSWPRDLEGKQTDDALREVLTPIGKKLP